MRLFEAHRGAVWAADGDGKQAIAIAFECGASREVTWALCTENPHAVRSRDKEGQMAASAGTVSESMPRVESLEWLEPPGF